jgi:hypothetical protein
MDMVRSSKYTRINTLSNNKTYVLIPRGKKCFIYFTMDNDEPCVMLYDKDRKYIKKIYVCFDEELSTGTIMYGTLIQRTFIAEYLCLYKNIKLQHNLNNLNTLQAVLSTDIKNTANTTQIKLPFMCNNKSISYFANVSYPVYGVVEYGHRFNIFVMHDLLANFIIKKDDIVQYRYNLYVMRNNEPVLHTNAFSNDIKTTFLIDTIFKKSKNYKTIEYSDTEDDDSNVDKQLNIPKLVTCIYIPELKKWKPYLVCRGKTADTFKTIRYIETNYS